MSEVFAERVELTELLKSDFGKCVLDDLKVNLEDKFKKLNDGECVIEDEIKTLTIHKFVYNSLSDENTLKNSKLIEIDEDLSSKKKELEKYIDDNRQKRREIKEAIELIKKFKQEFHTHKMDTSKVVR